MINKNINKIIFFLTFGKNILVKMRFLIVIHVGLLFPYHSVLMLQFRLENAPPLPLPHGGGTVTSLAAGPTYSYNPILHPIYVMHKFGTSVLAWLYVFPTQVFLFLTYSTLQSCDLNKVLISYCLNLRVVRCLVELQSGIVFHG